MNKLKIFILALAVTLSVYAVGWYPEGNTAAIGDDQRRSLHKINDLLATGASSAAPTLANATVVSWTSLVCDLDTNAEGIASAGGQSGTYYVRKALIQAVEANTVDAIIEFNDTGAQRVLAPGNEYVLDAGQGAKFNLNSFSTYVNSGTATLHVFILQ